MAGRSMGVGWGMAGAWERHGMGMGEEDGGRGWQTLKA